MYGVICGAAGRQQQCRRELHGGSSTSLDHEGGRHAEARGSQRAPACMSGVGWGQAAAWRVTALLHETSRGEEPEETREADELWSEMDYGVEAGGRGQVRGGWGQAGMGR